MIRFITEHGIEVPDIRADQMREIDRIAIKETGPNLYQVMENAGRNLALLSMELLGENWKKVNIIVLAGTGGNGGGGICAARHLANRNANVSLCLSNPERLSDITKYQYKIYQNTNGKEITSQNLLNESIDFIIDALIGYNLTGAPRGSALQLIRRANETSQPILSLDVPSGLDATTGEAAGEYIHANWIMTLALPKTGLIHEKTAELFLADIGIPPKTFELVGLNYEPPFRNSYYVRLSRR